MNIILRMLFTKKLFDYEEGSNGKYNFQFYDLQNHRTFRSNKYFMSLSPIGI